MSGLIFRLWLSAVLAFVAVFAIHETILVYVLYSEADFAFVEDQHGRGFLLAAETIANTPLEQKPQVVAHLSDLLDASIEIIDVESVSEAALARLANSPVALDVLSADAGQFIVPVPGSGKFMQAGPVFDLPRAFRLRHFVILVLAGCLFSALFWWQIRPLRRQHRTFEDAALSMAAGDRGIRVDPAKVPVASNLAFAFNRMAETTQARADAQKRLLWAVSHELRTPISRLRIGVHLLKQADDRTIREVQTDALDDDLEELNSLVGELLTYARFEGDAAPVRRRPVDVCEVLRSLSAEVEGSGIEVVVAIDQAPEDLTFQLAFRFFRRALSNLVRNACIYGVSRVEIHARLVQGALIVEVHDDGPGIAQGDRKKVFEPFLRLNSDAAEEGGYGLGLAIVRQIVRWHDGDVSIVRSRLGGCCVRTFWPQEIRD